MNGEKLRMIRKELRLQQTEIAEFLGVDNETVCRWEKQNKELSKLQSEAIAQLSQNPGQFNAIRGDRRRRRTRNRIERNQGSVISGQADT